MDKHKWQNKNRSRKTLIIQAVHGEGRESVL